jgi:S1-C subfamily serine protease
MLLAALLISVVAWGAVGAQDDTTPADAKPFLGVLLENTDEGVVVREVSAESAAEAAGLQVDDVITAINGDAVTTNADVAAIIGDLKPADAVTIEVTRGDETLTLEAELGSQPADSTAAPVPFGRGFNLRDAVLVYNDDDGVWEIHMLSEDSPLYDAGLRIGDVITALDGETYDPDSLSGYLAGLDADAVVVVTVDRDGETLDLEVPADELDVLGGVIMRFGRGGINGMPGMRDYGFENMPDFGRGMMFGRAYMGLSYTMLDEDTAAENELEVTEGALVISVVADSPAAEAGLQEGDVIVAVEGEVVDARRTLSERIFAYDPDEVVTLDVIRAGETIQIEVTLGQPDMAFGFGSMMPDNRGDRGQFRGSRPGRPASPPMPTPDQPDPAATPEVESQASA